MSAVPIFLAGLAFCFVGIFEPSIRGWCILAGFVCLLGGLYRLGD